MEFTRRTGKYQCCETNKYMRKFIKTFQFNRLNAAYNSNYDIWSRHRDKEAILVKIISDLNSLFDSNRSDLFLSVC